MWRWQLLHFTSLYLRLTRSLHFYAKSFPYYNLFESLLFFPTVLRDASHKTILLAYICIGLRHSTITDHLFSILLILFKSKIPANHFGAVVFLYSEFYCCKCPGCQPMAKWDDSMHFISFILLHSYNVYHHSRYGEMRAR